MTQISDTEYLKQTRVIVEMQLQLGLSSCIRSDPLWPVYSKIFYPEWQRITYERQCDKYRANKEADNASSNDSG